MITFVCCLIALIVGYFIYGKFIERIFGIDAKRQTPAYTHQDGVDYIPMPTWKVFMIQFLNIAGLGPIFGAIMGAKFGTASFLWIVLGSIFAGSVHDYLSGMLSLRHNGESLPEIIGRYLGVNFKQFMRGFTVILMVLVGSVFVAGPAGLLAKLTPEHLDTTFWIIVVFLYYILATLLPVDKIIGKIYPLFAAALLFMAIGILVMLFVNHPPLPEITDGMPNTYPGHLPIFPIMFVSIACGAISGFHATQSPLMARCIKNEKYGRPIFFGWFSNWSPEGPIRKGYLASLPDSIDMVSMWSGPFGLNEAKLADKEIFQKKKGGKITVCYILHNIGTGITPASVSEKVQAENPNASSEEITELVNKATEAYWGFTSGEKGAEDHIAAIQRYAKALVDTIVATDYDGLDIDWEPDNGGDGGRYVGSLKDRRGGPRGEFLHYLVEEIGKYFGPMATERPNGKYYYFMIDGEIWNSNKESAPYFDYFITQAYGDSNLDSRVRTLQNWCGEYYDYRKHVFTENFESSWTTGGVLLKQAAYNHANGPKGGVGAFRLDNDYDNARDYNFVRHAIQINLQAYQEYMDNQSNENTEQQ